MADIDNIPQLLTIDQLADRRAHAETLGVEGGPPDQPAQHISPALIAGHHAVEHHETRGANVIRNDAL